MTSLASLSMELPLLQDLLGTTSDLSSGPSGTVGLPLWLLCSERDGEFCLCHDIICLSEGPIVWVVVTSFLNAICGVTGDNFCTVPFFCRSRSQLRLMRLPLNAFCHVTRALANCTLILNGFNGEGIIIVVGVSGVALFHDGRVAMRVGRGHCFGVVYRGCRSLGGGSLWDRQLCGSVLCWVVLWLSEGDLILLNYSTTPIGGNIL